MHEHIFLRKHKMMRTITAHACCTKDSVNVNQKEFIPAASKEPISQWFSLNGCVTPWVISEHLLLSASSPHESQHHIDFFTTDQIVAKYALAIMLYSPDPGHTFNG